MGMHACHNGYLSHADCFRTSNMQPTKQGPHCWSGSRSFQLHNKKLTWKNTWLSVSSEVRSTASATLNSHLQLTFSTQHDHGCSRCWHAQTQNQVGATGRGECHKGA